MEFLTNLLGMIGESGTYVLAFLFVLTVVVFFHELGHFLVARWCGVTVCSFSIGFGPEIFGFYDKKGTRWRFAWIPLGGYVKFLDDNNAASVPDRDALAQMSEEESAGAFQTKPLYQRTAVVAAGPIANFVLAIVIYTLLFTFIGQRVLEPRVDKVLAGSPAAAAGFRAGDVVVEIDGEKIESLGELQRIEAMSAGRTLSVVVERGGTRIELLATPERKIKNDLFGNPTPLGELGIEQFHKPLVDKVTANGAAERAGFQPGDLVVQIDNEPIESFLQMQRIVSKSAKKELKIVVLRNGAEMTLRAAPDEREVKDGSGKMVKQGLLGLQREDESVLERYDPITALWLGTKETYTITAHTLTYLVRIVRGQESADQLGGPARIAQISGQVAQLGFPALIGLTALLSISIGLINLFPIPILDGGHLLYYAIEAVRGRPLSPRIQEIGFRIGLVLIIMLMIFVTRNDLIHFRFL